MKESEADFQQFRVKKTSPGLLVLKSIAGYYKVPESVILDGMISYLAHETAIARLMQLDPGLDDPATMASKYADGKPYTAGFDPPDDVVRRYFDALDDVSKTWGESYWSIFPKDLRHRVEHSASTWREMATQRAKTAASAPRRPRRTRREMKEARKTNES